MKPARLSIALLSSLLLAFSSVVSAQTLQKISSGGKIVIAYSKTSSPFSYDHDNKPVGYAVDVCAKLAEAVKKHLKQPQIKIEYAGPSFNDRLAGVKDGKFDMECGNTTHTAERAKTYAFTLPHYIATVRILVRADSPFKQIEDMRGKAFTTSANSLSERLLKDLDYRYVLNSKYVAKKTSPEAFAALEKGEADGFMFDEVVLSSQRANSAKPDAFRLLDQVYEVLPLAIVIRKDDPEFKKVLDKEMVRMILDGEMTQIYKKWFQTPIPPKNANLNLPLNPIMRDHFRFPSDAYIAK